MKKIAIWLLLLIGTFVFMLGVPDTTLAKKPPWVIKKPKKPKKKDPVSGPEPVTLTLIGMGTSAVVGYYLGRRKKK